MSVKTSADWFEHALAGNATSIRNAKKKWKGSKDSDGNTALMLVSKLEDNSVFDLLIYEEAGNMNNEGHSALSIAVLARRMDKVERLATLEGSMILGRGCTALIYAASVQDADVVPLLAPYSIIDQRNDEGYSALDIAVMNNDLAFVTSLIGAARVDLDTLDMALRYSLTPDSIRVNQILMDYRAATYPNSDPFDPDARPTSHQAPSTTVMGLNHQGTIDPKATDVASSEDPTQSRSEKQKSGRFSRAGSKQSSVRKTPKLDNASFSNSALVQSVARMGTPGPEEVSSVYGQVASNRSFESNANYTDQTTSRLTNGSVRLQDVGDPEYAVSHFGDAVRSTSLMGDPPQSATDLKSQKGGKASRAGSKQSSVRKTPKLETASFSNSALVQSVARIETPAPEDMVPASRQAAAGSSAAYGETYAMSMEVPVDGYVDSELRYSVTPNEILTDVGYSRDGYQGSTSSAVLSRLRTPTSSVIADSGAQGPGTASARALKSASQPLNTYSTGSFSQAGYPGSALSTRSITESMPVQSRRAIPESASVTQLQELVREKQAIIDDLQNQNMKLNKELVELKRRLHKAELVSGSASQGHWATQSSIDKTNLVIADMQEQAREMKTEAIRAKNFFERERERLNGDISEKTKRIAVLENTNRNMETSCERLRAANKDLIEQLTKKKTDDSVTEMVVAQKDAEIGELRDRIKELENDVVRLTQKVSSHTSVTGRSRNGDETTVSQLTNDSNLRGYSAQAGNSTKLSAGPDEAGASEASLQDVVRQLTAMNNSKDIIISELRGELANLRDISKRSQQDHETSRSKAEDMEMHDVKMALADLQARHDALSEDNSKTLEKLRVRTRELQGLVEEVESEIPAGNMGTQTDISRMKAIVKIKNREIAELKESALNTASRHAATCKAINAENERLNAALRRKENELTKIHSELSTARDFQDHVEGVRSENTQLMKEMKRMRAELEKQANIHPELAKYESLVKTLGEENDTMRRVLKRRKEQIEYLKNGGDPSLLHTVGTGSRLSGTTTPVSKTQMLSGTSPHSDIINRDAKGNDVLLVKKLTEEVGSYSDKVTELSRMIALKDAEISLLRKQTTDGATYKDLLCLLNEKMKRVDQLNADVEQRDREITKLVTINRTGTAKPKGLTASIYKSPAISRFYSHDEVKDLLKQLSDKEAEIALLRSETMNNSYEKIHNLGDKFAVVKIENLEDKVAVLNAHLADREGTIERLQAQLQDAELALQSHRANLGLIGIGGMMASGSYASHKDRTSASPSTVMSPDLAYSKSLEASNASLQQKLADSKLKIADAQQELEWAQMRMDSMHSDLQRYKDRSGTANTPTAEGRTPQQHSTPLSMTGQRPVLEPKNHTPTYNRGK
ncbi:Coiled-coil protein [Giardia lamblia P15]|uniref:Coiled-coil protein n=1 Tax=Giardia intestinalis (strain P15) TaxID=658858 RepID=E1EYW5_GIAIA|nr:Coiled-coil protein [Giardia lamblia P15]